ncbi:TlpA family protein disulfide reductase [Methylobacterium sp. BTF04]|uniref:TlpA family protein disulfide reductase n=1 Tax=Methylobacterium sp. BTF04 TaxID=2708300 RepID=UPI0013D6894C|nr:TlpA disulfide reductase family protein [Methylobacterium sp. BTF04]NEU12652.1 TlpA family protein disulfide reductase [Methylobacterium sp. BTF04]
MSQTELLIGDPAPALRVSGFLKGAPIPAFEPGTVYVVECWATWCGPCLRSIPHLTTLQATYPQVRILGVAVMEPDPEKVRAFVEERGDALGYTVATDLPPDELGGRGWMHRAWCRAAYQMGIPTAFIVDRAGRIAWIGHPMEIDDALNAVVEDTWDLAARAKAHRDEIVAQKVREAAAMNAAVERCRNAGDLAGAIDAYDETFACHPELEAAWGLYKLGLQFTVDKAGHKAYARHLIEVVAPQSPGLHLVVGMTLLKAYRAGAGENAPLSDDTLARLAVDALLKSEDSVAQQSSPPYAMAQIKENLAEALLASGRTREALARAQSARDWATKADAAAVLARIADLIVRCEGAAEAIPAASPTVVCVGDVCQIMPA